MDHRIPTMSSRPQPQPASQSISQQSIANPRPTRLQNPVHENTNGHHSVRAFRASADLAPIDAKRSREGNVRLQRLFDDGAQVLYEKKPFQVMEFRASNAEKQYRIESDDHSTSKTVAVWKLVLRTTGRNALHLAASKGLVAEVRYLCTKMKDQLNAKGNYGWTALMHAAFTGHTDCLKALLQQEGIQVNATLKKGSTALMLAAQKGHTDCLKALLQQEGIQVNAKHPHGRTALMFAAVTGHTECLKALLQQEGIQVNAKETKGFTALMLAAYNGHTECLEALLQRDDIQVNAKDPNGRTALMLAAQNGHTDCLELLLAQGANIEATNTNGQTALLLATAKGAADCVRLLEAAAAAKETIDDLNEVDAALSQTTTFYAAGRLKRTQDYELQVRLLHDQSQNPRTNPGDEARLVRRAGDETDVQRLLDERNAAVQQQKETELKQTYEADLAKWNAEERAKKLEIEAKRTALHAQYSAKFVEEHTCAVCLAVKESLGVAFDCGHRVCKGCAPRVAQCPKCRHVSGTRPIYASVRHFT